VAFSISGNIAGKLQFVTDRAWSTFTVALAATSNGGSGGGESTQNRWKRIF
jgi:hypothetical protein